MSKKLAIRFTNVHKTYNLFTSPTEVIMELIGINKLLKRHTPTFQALKDVNLTINKGDRIGIIGQNGAGKTTLLKLATENYPPTKGKVEIHGKVQSLMDSGLGFHPEFTGRENIKSSLIYNGLTTRQMKEAFEDIIEFAELGEFIDQPIKTYSLGMVSRLGFATATAIHPEILIVDEIMGAGDAYFVAKSSERMKKLTKDGTTLLLVSHSTAQIIQFCDQAIWMKDKNIHMQGEALEVCKAYSKYMRELDEARLEKQNKTLKNNFSLNQRKNAISISPKEKITPDSTYTTSTIDIELTENYQNRSVSRWNSSGEILIEDFHMVNANNEKRFTFCSGEKVEFIMTIRAQKEGFYPCTYAIVTYTLSGHPVTVHVHTEDSYFKEGEQKTIRLIYPELLLGNGDYVISPSIYKQLDLDDTSTASFYDLLDRSFEFKVINKHKLDITAFIHPAKWKIN
ncbi:MAG: ABC transporter ATP-binding protein [Candidatus Rickettsia vulgarisii]